MWIAFGILLAVEAPAARLHEVVDVVDVERVGREREAERRACPSGAARDGLCTAFCMAKAVSKISSRLVAGSPGGPGCTIDAQVAAIRPPERLPARPGETYMPPFQSGRGSTGAAGATVAEQQHRRALQAVAVLVRVGGDAGDARQAEVEDRNVVAELLAPRQDEAAEAAVDVQADVVLERRGPRARRSDRSCRRDSCPPSPTSTTVLRVDVLAHEVDVDERRRRDRPAPTITSTPK